MDMMKQISLARLFPEMLITSAEEHRGKWKFVASRLKEALFENRPVIVALTEAEYEGFQQTGLSAVANMADYWPMESYLRLQESHPLVRGRPALLLLRSEEIFSGDWQDHIERIDYIAQEGGYYAVALPPDEYERLAQGGFEQLKSMVRPEAQSIMHLTKGRGYFKDHSVVWAAKLKGVIILLSTGVRTVQSFS